MELPSPTKTSQKTPLTMSSSTLENSRAMTHLRATYKQDKQMPMPKRKKNPPKARVKTLKMLTWSKKQLTLKVMKEKRKRKMELKRAKRRRSLKGRASGPVLQVRILRQILPNVISHSLWRVMKVIKIEVISKGRRRISIQKKTKKIKKNVKIK